MKRILIASDTLLPRWDGVSSSLNEIIPRLSKHYKVSVLAPRFDGDFKGYEGVRIIRFPLLKRIKLADTFPCKPSFRTVMDEVGKCDLVWAQDIAPVAVLSIIAAKIKKKPCVAYVHSLEWELYTKAISAKGLKAWFISNVMKLIDKVMYNMCNLLLVPSLEIGEILGWRGIKTAKRIVHLGTDPQRFKPPLNKDSAKKALGLSPKAFVIGYAGRVGVEKDLVTLLRAFFRVHRKHSETVLLIAGGGSEIIQPFVNSRDDVHVFGKTDHIEKYFQAMDVYVLPSLTETSSLSTIEAMSCGLAVVSTPVGFVKDYIKEGYDGMFFPKGNPLALSRKLEKLITDPVLRKSMGFNARKTVLQKFSWDKTVNEIKEVFNAFL